MFCAASNEFGCDCNPKQQSLKVKKHLTRGYDAFCLYAKGSSSRCKAPRFTSACKKTLQIGRYTRRAFGYGGSEMVKYFTFVRVSFEFHLTVWLCNPTVYNKNIYVFMRREKRWQRRKKKKTIHPYTYITVVRYVQVCNSIMSDSVIWVKTRY